MKLSRYVLCCFIVVVLPFACANLFNSTIAVTGLSLSQTTLDLTVGGATATLTATIAPSNATNMNVSWSSSDTAVATVSSSGVVSPVAAGTATITVTAADKANGTISASCTVAVNNVIAVTGLSLNQTTMSLTAGGATGSLTATITPSDATNMNVSWSSGNTAVATVSSNGVVSPVAVGTATITVTAADTTNGTKTASCTVTVAAPSQDTLDVAADITALGITYASGDSALSVTGNLGLPTVGASGTTISWASSHPAIVTTAGLVTRPTSTTTVTLTATVGKGAVYDTKTFDVAVIQVPATDAQAVAADKAVLAIGYTGGDTAARVTRNLTLPQSGPSGTTIVWSSDQPSIVSTSGVVTRPASNTSVTLMAELSKGIVSDTKTFTVMVIVPDAQAVDADKATLAIGYASGDSASKVTGNLVLSSTGANGTTVSWISDHPEIVTATGVVMRPASTTAVNLMATIAMGTASATKVFTVTVIMPDAQAVAADKASLAIGYASGDSASSVTQDLTLPFVGPNMTIISWSSSQFIVSSTGGVFNPGSSASVILTATVAMGSASDTRSFMISVAHCSLAMVVIPGGSFNNGTSDVTISGFSMSKYDITQVQYSGVMGYNPSNFSGNPDASSCPVEMVTWYDAVEFCNKLSTAEGLQPVYTIEGRTPADGYPITSATVTANWSNTGYRLPTEAQWEYAARAGTTTPFYWGDASDDATVGQYAWYSTNSGNMTHGVGQKLPNGFGLYDMAGNVWQLCWDWYGDYPSEPQTDPVGPTTGSDRVVRGGSCISDAWGDCTVAYHFGRSGPGYRWGFQGFRVARP